jgi:hypothetical protein
MTWRLENSRSFMLDKALHPVQVWIQGPVHPLGQRRSEQAQEPVEDAVGCEGTPRSDRRCRGFAPQSERQGLVTGLSPSMSGGRSIFVSSIYRDPVTRCCFHRCSLSLCHPVWPPGSRGGARPGRRRQARE